MKNIVFVFHLISMFSIVNLSAQNRNINIDLDRTNGSLPTMMNECIGAGRANEGLRADWQQQLRTAQKECGFKYIRMHGLLTDDMAVYREDNNGNPIYNYQYIDVLYDFLLSIDMKPFVEFGFMPKALASGKQTIFWWKGNVTPPKDYEKWKNLIENLVKHWTERYGEEEVALWYFEIWNEPNLSPGFWTGTQEEYFKLYQFAVEGIKNVNPNYKVGGPATAGAAWVPEMIQFCETNAVPIDFISTHTYGVKQGYLDETATSGTILSKDQWAVSGDVLKSRKQISNSTKPKLELHYTEWSSSYTPADPIHDSYHQASYILEKLKQVGSAANSMSYWVFTDIFEEAGPRTTPFHGGFGLMNYQGIKKSAYFAYSYLNKLGSSVVENSDESSWVCKSDNGNFQLLLWDFTYTHPGDSVLNQMYYNRDLPSKSKGKVNIEIRNIPKGKYQLKLYKIGYETNDPYTQYFKMGSHNQLSREQVLMIKKQNSGAPILTKEIKINNGQNFNNQLPINENDVYLFEFEKIK